MKDKILGIIFVISLFVGILAGTFSASAADDAITIGSAEEFVKLMDGTYAWDGATSTATITK